MAGASVLRKIWRPRLGAGSAFVERYMGLARAGEEVCLLAIRIVNGWPFGHRSGIQGENDLADVAAGLHQGMSGSGFGKGECLEDQRLDLAGLQQWPDPF